MGIPAPLGVNASGLPPTGDQANAVVSGSISHVGPKKPFAFRGPMNLALYASIVTALTTTQGSTAASVASGTNITAGCAINSVNVPYGTTWATFAGTSGTLAFPQFALMGTATVPNAQISGLSSTAGLLGATVSGPFIPSGTTVTAILTAAVAPTDTSPGTPGVIQLSTAPTQSQPTNAPIAYEFSPTANAVTTGTDNNALFTGASVVYSGSVQLERSFDGCATWLLCNVGSAGALAQWSAGTPVNITFGEPERQVYYRFNCTAFTSGPINYRISQTGGAAESLAIGPLSGG